MSRGSQSSAVRAPRCKRGRRSICVAIVGALAVVAATFSAVAAAENSGETGQGHPGFIFQPVHSSNEGAVFGVYEARHADLVLVEGGFDSGFQAGMVCRVSNNEGEVGEVLLVEVRNNCSAALILQLEEGKVVEPGHLVRIKTVTF